MDTLAELSRIVDALVEETSQPAALDAEYCEKIAREVRDVIRKLIEIERVIYLRERSLYLRRASYNQWDLKRMEKEYIQRVLEECSGNQSRAAKQLGIARNTLWQKLKEFSADEE